MNRHIIVACACACACVSLHSLGAQAAPPRDTVPARDTTAHDSTVHLETVKVTTKQKSAAAVPRLQQLTLPATASVTEQQAQRTVNLVDPEDAVKYLPSLFIRKRNFGDTQATVGTRVWGVSSSARSLVFVDGIPITALIANNNTIGGPRWGLVSPDEISRIDVMYGPYSAAYSGNSMGAVMAITTRMPDSLEGSLAETQALQQFSLYGTHDTYGTSLTQGHVGDRFGRFAFWASGDYEHSRSQPLTYVTAGTQPKNTTGGYAGETKLGAPSMLLGAGGLLRTDMLNTRVKASYDVTPWLQAAYTIGLWHNGGTSTVDTYVDATNTAAPTYAGASGFASGFYTLDETHIGQSLALRTDTKKDWDGEAIITQYRFDTDQQRSPSSASSTATSFSPGGKLALYDGTGWWTADLKGAWHRGGLGARHTVTFGAHYDEYRLFNPTYATTEWRDGAPGAVLTEGDGRTRTDALWAQDAWLISPAFTLTVGGRYEWWHAWSGYNVNGGTAIAQPAVSATRFSPKGILAWTPNAAWSVTASVGKAYRFPTVAELYQLVSTGATYTAPAPNLRPDNDLSAELRGARQFTHGSVGLALFEDDVHDAIISQYLPLGTDSTTLYSYLSNVDHVRARGVGLSLGSNDLFVHGLGFSGSATYLDARTLALSGRASASAPAGSAVGKFLPNIPRWRATAATTYAPTNALTLTLAGRYSGKMYTTLDDADVAPNVYQGFGEWFVADAKAEYRFTPQWSASLGVDNLLNRKYFLFHPFPQRTFVASVRVGF